MIDKKIPLYVLSLHARKTVYNIRNICAINKMLKTCSKNDNTYNLFGRKLLHKYVKHAMLVSVFFLWVNVIQFKTFNQKDMRHFSQVKEGI